MKLKIRQLTSMLMVAAVVTMLFAGCGNASSTQSAASEPSASAATVVASNDVQPEATPEAEAAVSEQESSLESALDQPEDDGFVEVPLPLADEPVELTAFKPLVPYLSGSGAEEFSDWAFFRYMEEAGNIKFHFETCDTSSGYEMTNLILASGDLPDIMSNLSQYYTAGLDNAIEESLIVDLSAEADQIPNYIASLKLNDNFMRQCYTPSGKLGAAYRLDVETEGVNNGIIMRGDLIDAVNMETPKTYDDFDALFKAWHDELGMSGFLAITKYGVEKAFSSGFETVGAGDTPFYVKDGTVQFGPANEGYRECLELMHKWYAAGYINDQFVNWTTFSISADVILQDNIACTAGTPPQIAVIVQDALQETDPNASIVPACFPTKNPGDLTHMRRSEEYIGESISITTSTEDLDTCLAYINYLYSDEGTFVANYGTENVSFVYDENGEPKLTDLVVNNPDNLSLSAALCVYTRYSGPFRNYASRYTGSYDPLIQACTDVWTNEDDDAYNIPSFMDSTAEQSTAYNAIWSDMSTYILEWSNRVIVGTNELNDDTWAEYLDTLDSMDVEKLTEIEQDIYNQYLAKDALLGIG